MTGDTAVTICSTALARLGDDPITALTDNTERARLCNRLYDPIRRKTLRAHRWNFAMAMASLASLSYTAVFGPGHKFQLPADNLRIVEMDPSDQTYVIHGGTLLTDGSTANVYYLKDVTDATLFDALFVEALSLHLAAEMAYAITGSREMKVTVMQEYSEKLKEARQMDAQEGTPPFMESDALTSVRLGYSDGTAGKQWDS